MMKKMKQNRFMAGVLASAMALSLAACGNTAEKSPASESPKADTQVSTENTGSVAAAESEAVTYDPLGAYDETLTLTFSRYMDIGSSYPEGVTTDNNGYIDYIADKLNIKCETAFEAEAGSEEYDRHITMAMASGELPDVLVISGGNGKGKSLVKELYENDMIWDLTEVFENYASDELKKIFDSYPDNAAYDLGSVDDRLVAIPQMAGLYYNMVWIRQDWLDALGIKLDEDGNGIISREDLVETAKAFKEADFGGNGTTVGLSMTANTTGLGTSLVQLAHSFGGFMDSYLVDENGSVYHGSTTEETKEALAWMAELYKEGVIDPAFGTRTQDNLKEMCINNQLGIAFGVWHMPDWFFNSVYEANPEATLVAYNIDNGNGKVNYPMGNISDNFMVVSKTCENPEAAIKILNLVNVHYNNYMTATEAKAEVPELYAQGQAGMGLYARPIALDLKEVSAHYQSQILPALQYMDGTGTLKLEELGTASQRIIAGTAAAEEGTLNKLESPVWAGYHSRMKGIMQCKNLTDNDLYEVYHPVYGTTPTMESSPVDLGGLEDETFSKIIVGELPIEAFDTYVEEWNAQGGAAICEELEAMLN